MRQAGRDTVAADRVPPTRADSGPPGGRKRGRPSGRRAAARFQLACVRLASSGPKDGTVWRLDELVPGAAPATAAALRESDAASALIELAEAGDGEALRALLRPDPARAAASWSVACYRIGDLVPHSLRDFTDPVDAVTTLADCGDPDHLAAELVASTSDGLCWVPLVRTGERVRFQFFDRHSVLDRPGRRAVSDEEHGAVASAQAHWAESVAAWHARQGPVGRITTDGSSPGAPPLSWAGSTGAGGTSPASGAAAFDALGASGAGASGGSFGQPWGSPASDIAVTLEELVDAVSTIAEVVERLERTLGAVAARLEGLVPSPSAAGVRAVGPRRVPPHPPSVDADPLPGAGQDAHDAHDAHHWWAPRHRASRERPPVSGQASESR